MTQFQPFFVLFLENESEHENFENDVTAVEGEKKRGEATTKKKDD